MIYPQRKISHLLYLYTVVTYKAVRGLLCTKRRIVYFDPPASDFTLCVDRNKRDSRRIDIFGDHARRCTSVGLSNQRARTVSCEAGREMSIRILNFHTLSALRAKHVRISHGTSVSIRQNAHASTCFASSAFTVSAFTRPLL